MIPKRFLNAAGPTDVLSFPMDGGGEIAISIETARREAGARGLDVGRELAL